MDEDIKKLVAETADPMEKRRRGEWLQEWRDKILPNIPGRDDVLPKSAVHLWMDCMSEADLFKVIPRYKMILEISEILRSHDD